ncbi:MAG: hypothetical protein U1F24_00820 [Alphaproteobacteria bacterium]
MPRLPTRATSPRSIFCGSPISTPASPPTSRPALAPPRRLLIVEDDLPLCDFHTPAVVTRGALVIAAALGGGSPALAAIVRERLEEAFPVAWGPALDDVAAARRQMRSAGAAPAEIAADARRRLAETKLIWRGCAQQGRRLHEGRRLL